MKFASKLITQTILLLLLATNQTSYTLTFLEFIAGPLLIPLLKKNKSKSNNTSIEADDASIDPKDIKEDFESVILEDDIKNKFKMIVQFIKNPEKFNKLGAKPPKGILLYGPPGTGKTSLGRALAKASDATFIYLAGSEIDGMFVGDGAKKIKEKFDLARKKGPAIIFIDEIDTIAKKRMGEESRFHTQTVQQLLIEMDGFKQSDKPVIVIGTTNNVDHLDKALLRSGRFDIHLEIKNPTVENRKKIFLKLVAKIKMSKNINDQAISKLCLDMDGFSGADIENVVNQATFKAVTDGKEIIELANFTKAINELKKQKEQ